MEDRGHRAGREGGTGDRREAKGKGITSANWCVELIQLRALEAQSQGPVSHRSVKGCDPRNSTVAPGVVENGNTQSSLFHFFSTVDETRVQRS